LRLGATWALNLDGGGSTTMFLNGELMNRPSDGRERPVGSALLVLPGDDPGEVEPAEPSGVEPHASPTPAGSSSPDPSPSGLGFALGPRSVAALRAGAGGTSATGPAATCAALTDPASTGGLLDALAKGSFGRRQTIPPSLRWALDVFRGARPC